VGGISGIIKRNKYAPQQPIAEENVSSIRLPKLGGGNPRMNLEHNNNSILLPSINGIPSVNGQGILTTKAVQQYHPYIVKPTKLKSIPKPLLIGGPGQGIAGERININKYGGGA